MQRANGRLATDDEVPVALRFDGSAAPLLYLGIAAPGSLTSAPVWQIQRINTTVGVVIQNADGNGAFDNIWDNRAALSYS